MKQHGKHITGNPVSVDRFTAGWNFVKIHPTSYYRRQKEILEGLKKSKGFYTDIDMGQFVIIRFSEKDDLTTFHRDHHAYI